jgi:hypothetical protein
VKHINWNELSELGLLERINREILHPLGLAVSRDPNTGVSSKILIAPDGVFEYPTMMKSKIKSDDFVLQEISKIQTKEIK